MEVCHGRVMLGALPYVFMIIMDHPLVEPVLALLSPSMTAVPCPRSCNWRS